MLQRYGPDVELDSQSLQRLLRLRTTLGESLHAREDRRRLALDHGLVSGADAGHNVVRIEEILVIDERERTVTLRPQLSALGNDPKSALRSLGVTHFLQVERRPGDPRGSLLAPLVASAMQVFVVDPSSCESGTREAFLPTEMDFPLTGLWSVERPGPWMALHRLQ